MIPSIIVGNMAVVQQSGMNGEKPNFTIGSRSEDGFVSGNLQEEVIFLHYLRLLQHNYGLLEWIQRKVWLRKEEQSRRTLMFCFDLAVPWTDPIKTVIGLV